MASSSDQAALDAAELFSLVVVKYFQTHVGLSSVKHET